MTGLNRPARKDPERAVLAHEHESARRPVGEGMYHDAIRLAADVADPKIDPPLQTKATRMTAVQVCRSRSACVLMKPSDSRRQVSSYRRSFCDRKNSIATLRACASVALQLLFRSGQTVPPIPTVASATAATTLRVLSTVPWRHGRSQPLRAR